MELSTTIYMIGNTCGAVFLTPLSDKIGRKKTILFLLWLQAIVGVVSAVSNGYILFTVSRFFVGLLNMVCMKDIFQFIWLCFVFNCMTS